MPFSCICIEVGPRFTQSFVIWSYKCFDGHSTSVLSVDGERICTIYWLSAFWRNSVVQIDMSHDARKSVFGGSDQVQHKLACAATGKIRKGLEA